MLPVTIERPPSSSDQCPPSLEHVIEGVDSTSSVKAPASRGRIHSMAANTLHGAFVVFAVSLVIGIVRMPDRVREQPPYPPLAERTLGALRKNCSVDESELRIHPLVLLRYERLSGSYNHSGHLPAPSIERTKTGNGSSPFHCQFPKFGNERDAGNAGERIHV